MGENKINDMMKSILANAILESSDKKFTNHSARKTVVSKLKKANVERLGIVKVTKHKTIQSLHDYDNANEEDGFRRKFEQFPQMSAETNRESPRA